MFAAPWDEPSLAALLAHPGSVALVACQGAPPEVGGFGLAQIAADEAEILTLGVAEGWRRKGVGMKLVEGLKRAAQKAGARTLFLEVADSNAGARALYQRCGFAEAAIRKGYYAREKGLPAEDAVVLEVGLA